MVALPEPDEGAVRIGPEGLPKQTLGWQILEWTAEWLLQPDGVRAGEPWRFSPEQARFVLWWYAIDDNGRFIYRRGMLRRIKGWGKDPLGAALCCVEFVGPCRFGGEKDGKPIAIPVHSAWIQTAAVAKEQTRNTMTLFPGMLSKQALQEYAIDMGKEIIYAHHGRCRIEAVTSSPRALEGGRATFVLKNETHHWLQNNEGHAMASVIARNSAKIDGRVLAISNAHNPGEDSDAERDYEAWLKIDQGRSKATGFLYDSLEAPPGTVLADRDSLRAGLLAARGDSVWVPVENLIETIYDPTTAPSEARRFYLNQIVAAEDAWIAPNAWDEREDAEHVVPDGAIVTLGFDGSETDDHTAFVGCEVETGYLLTLGIWDPELHGGEIPRDEVDGVVRQAFEKYDVVGFFGDLHPWESYIDDWSRDFAEGTRKRGGLCVNASPRSPIGWDMRGRLKEYTFGVEAFLQAALDKVLTHDGNSLAMQHVKNARRRPNQYGVSFGKEHRESMRKVDWLAAAVLARMARQAYLALPDNRKRRKKTGGANFF